MSYSLKNNSFNTGSMAQTKIHIKGQTWFKNGKICKKNIW